VSDIGINSWKPDDLSPFATRVFETLAKYTAFPWPMMMAQCARVDVDPRKLDASGLERALVHLIEAVARYSSPEKAAAVREDLTLLIAAPA